MVVIGRVAIVIQSLMSVEPPLHGAVTTLQYPLYMFSHAEGRRRLPELFKVDPRPPRRPTLPLNDN